ncbi:PREDICTED: vinorine synthase-like [Nicotiana attenuata]|uniref:Bahd acyltransferase n=1 Tax=Nicotiana attenuata TaxID=49451 RepID=A0A314KKW3_NICAT|nr:PREDICTED: vinorine synthase-like [Nicotiana attenuata]OIT30081.1 bahd acyltransferase [Nicotiana attenuata]
MAAKVEIISKEMIKPSFPTTCTLRTHKLSLLDQISPPVFIPLIFFYQDELGNINRSRNIQLLKKSLSDALTRFYPLAGRFADNNFIDCNDAGAEFIEAQVHGHLSQVIETPKMEELREFLPREACEVQNNDVLLAVQVNLFDCGGIAIGVCMSHKVGDGSSIVTFINAWAAIIRGDSTGIVQPNFNLSSIYPPLDLSKSSFKPSIGIKKDKLLTRRFVFNKEKLDAIKKSASGSQVKDPTRVEALSAYVWKHLMKVSKLNRDSTKMFAAVHAVNIRSRMNPTLPYHSFGNLWTTAVAFLSPKSEEIEIDDLLYHLRSAIRKINSDYTEILQNGEEFLKRMSKLAELFSKKEVEFYNFSSWCRFPVYEVDFGWGKPVWVCTTTFPYQNTVIFVGTKCGEGIEAWVNMLEDDDFFEIST